jgi:hypothetical protein
VPEVQAFPESQMLLRKDSPAAAAAAEEEERRRDSAAAPRRGWASSAREAVHRVPHLRRDPQEAPTAAGRHRDSP